MKKLITFFFFTALYVQLIVAQNVGALITDFNLIFMASDNTSLDFTKFAGKGVAVNVIYKAKDGTTLYTEYHEGTLDDLAGITFQIGTGTNPEPPLLTIDLLIQIAIICWSGTVETDDGTKPFTGMKAVTPTNFANYAHHAGNSSRFGGNLYVNQLLTTEGLFNGFENKGFLVRGPDGANPPDWTAQEYPVREFMKQEDKTSAATNNPIELILFGNDPHDTVTIPRAFSIGSRNPDKVENQLTFYTNGSADFYNGVGFVNQAATTSPGHNTAALFACNEEPTGSVGLFAKGNSWAYYGEGKNGGLGITTTNGSGAGMTGFVGVEPESGFFGYGVYANSQNLANAYGLAGFGPGFNTGVFPIGSDARLKNKIQSQTTVLDQVMRLRPSVYTYKQDIPYGFPKGLHHGFIAQELEEVFPEMVSDILLPASMEPDHMLSSGSVSYKAINYIEMVSILTSAVQELNTNLTAKIDAQAAEIAELRLLIEEIATKK